MVFWLVWVCEWNRLTNSWGMNESNICIQMWTSEQCSCMCACSFLLNISSGTIERHKHTHIRAAQQQQQQQPVCMWTYWIELNRVCRVWVNWSNQCQFCGWGGAHSMCVQQRQMEVLMWNMAQSVQSTDWFAISIMLFAVHFKTSYCYDCCVSLCSVSIRLTIIFLLSIWVREYSFLIRIENFIPNKLFKE